MRAKPLLFALLLLASVTAFAPAAGARALQRLIAPADACRGQTEAEAPAAVQERAMRCLGDYARAQAGLGRLGDDSRLDRSAADKSGDILRCDSFSHHACGRRFTYWMQRVGYLPARCWRAGENLAWGVAGEAAPRAIFRAWIHSPEHRANILGRYDELGIGLVVGGLDGRSGVHVWTQHFGSRCGHPGHPPRASHLARLSAARLAL